MLGDEVKSQFELQHRCLSESLSKNCVFKEPTRIGQLIRFLVLVVQYHALTPKRYNSFPTSTLSQRLQMLRFTRCGRSAEYIRSARFDHLTNCVQFVICVLTSLGMLHNCGITSAQESSKTELEKILADICRKQQVPSLTIAVVRSDEIVTMECSGVRKSGTDDAIELSDRHPLGSNTKSMTATLAAKVVESGKIKWDSTIRQVWPDAAPKHIHPSLHDVTLNELLSHQSGLAANLTDLGGNDWGSFFQEKASPTVERRRMLMLIMKKKAKHSRGEYHYSNIGYVVAAAMLEKSTGEEFEAMMHRDIFKPLKMDSADFRTLASAKKLKAPLLWGHQDNGNPISPRKAGAENPSAYASAGTVHLAIADYAKYAQWHLAQKPAPVLSTQEALDHLHKGQIEVPSLGGKYGGGWIHLKTPLGPAMTHGGSNTNSYASIWIFPDKDFAAVVCSNAGLKFGFPASDKAVQELIKRYAK